MTTLRILLTVGLLGLGSATRKNQLLLSPEYLELKQEPKSSEEELIFELSVEEEQVVGGFDLSLDLDFTAKVDQEKAQNLQEEFEEFVEDLLPESFLEQEETDSEVSDLDVVFEVVSQSGINQLDIEIDSKQDMLDRVNQEISDLESTESEEQENCLSNTTCESCTLNSGCVWCPEDNSCVEGDENGPQEGTCSNYQHGQCTILDCDSYTSCSSCLNNSACGWCASDSTCYEAENAECSDEDLYYIESEENNFCPEEDTETFTVLYSTEDQKADKLDELELIKQNLEQDIDWLQEEKEELLETMEDYGTSFLQKRMTMEPNVEQEDFLQLGMRRYGSQNFLQQFLNY